MAMNEDAVKERRWGIDK